MTHYDQRESLYEAQQAQAERAAREELPGNATDTLYALVKRGPLSSGHIPSKAGLNYLLERKLAVQMASTSGEWAYAATTAGRLLFDARERLERERTAKDYESHIVRDAAGNSIGIRGNSGYPGPRGDEIPAIAKLLEGIPAALRDHEDVVRCVTLTVQSENFRPAERFPGELPHLRNKVRDLLALHAIANEEPARSPALLEQGGEVTLNHMNFTVETPGLPPVRAIDWAQSIVEPSAHAHGVDPNAGHSFDIREPAPHAHGFTVDPNGGHSMSISPPGGAHTLMRATYPHGPNGPAVASVADQQHTHAAPCSFSEHCPRANGATHAIPPTGDAGHTHEFALTGEFRQSGRVLEHGVQLRARIYADGSMVIDNPARPLVVYPAAHVGAHALEPLTIMLKTEQSDEVLARIEQWTKGAN